MYTMFTEWSHNVNIVQETCRRWSDGGASDEDATALRRKTSELVQVETSLWRDVFFGLAQKQTEKFALQVERPERLRLMPMTHFLKIETFSLSLFDYLVQHANWCCAFRALLRVGQEEIIFSEIHRCVLHTSIVCMPNNEEALIKREGDLESVRQIEGVQIGSDCCDRVRESTHQFRFC